MVTNLWFVTTPPARMGQIHPSFTNSGAAQCLVAPLLPIAQNEG